MNHRVGEVIAAQQKSEIWLFETSRTNKYEIKYDFYNI